jgi:hypothetical protein
LEKLALKSERLESFGRDLPTAELQSLMRASDGEEHD